MNSALIWGASGGIGRALVHRLKSEGWRVFGVARTIKDIPSEADMKLTFEAGDQNTYRDVNFALANEIDGLDLMIYAVGSLQSAKLSEMPYDDWSAILESNLSGAYLAISHSIGLIKPQGHIVVIGAYIDHLILPQMGAYAVAKAGLDPLVAILRKEHRKHRFSIVRPGAVDTDFWENAPFRKPDAIKSPETVAQAILDHHLSTESGDLNL